MPDGRAVPADRLARLTCSDHSVANRVFGRLHVNSARHGRRLSLQSGARRCSERAYFRDIWVEACRDPGVSGLHPHDLRYAGNTMAAATGASLRVLMERMGLSSSRAALIYRHATRERDDAIATAMGACWRLLAASARARAARHETGTTQGCGVLMDAGQSGAAACDLGLRVGACDIERAKGIEPS